MEEVFFVVEIKKNGVWITTEISSTNLQEVNKKLIEYFDKYQYESRIIQKVPIYNLKPKRKGCC